MTRRRLVGTLGVVACAAAVAAGPAQAGNGQAIDSHSKQPLTLAIIGDAPYGPVQAAAFPTLVDWIDDDPKVRGVVHLGDIKNGSTVCSDDYFAQIRRQFDTFEDPFVYTPGDNEWTDCHRANNGGYLPTERLARLRSVFFDEPGETLGRRTRRVLDQSEAGLPENVLWMQSQVVFATVHAVGSNNGLAPWFGGAETPEQRTLRLEEVDGRLAGGLAWVDEAFDTAAAHDAAGIVLAMQADTWSGADQSGFEALKRRIESRAAAFGRPVLLLQGDSHRYLTDRPFPGAPNVVRVVVEGETIDEWLRLTIDPRSPSLFAWTREQR